MLSRALVSNAAQRIGAIGCGAVVGQVAGIVVAEAGVGDLVGGVVAIVSTTLIRSFATYQV